jgi:hypothetical protein
LGNAKFLWPAAGDAQIGFWNQAGNKAVPSERLITIGML